MLYSTVKEEEHCTKRGIWIGAGVKVEDEEDFNMCTSLKLGELMECNNVVL